MNIRADSTELATATVTVDHDITGKTVQVSLPATGQATSTWVTATVLGTVQVGPNWVSTYQILIGPASGDIQLAAGTYDWTVKVVDTPEVPVRKAGVVVVTAS
jgi:hypothetical protein